MHTRKAITEAIRKLGVQTGDLLMVHASLKAIGPVEGGAETVVAALRSAVGPTGTVMGRGAARTPMHRWSRLVR
ncbi:aminoglycoside acetyltransferase [Klebsiella pneumoniae]|nr:aminoglycoside acetyltransferase [Klebsiella pneumoniae]